MPYYYSTNGDGTTHRSFEPFKDGDRVEAPDWNPDPKIECGKPFTCPTLKLDKDIIPKKEEIQ